MTTFKRNAIIAGYINSYCLVCESFFETEDQTFSHIKEEEHKKKLLLYPYIEKYRNNCIRKVKAGYFCEHCSLLMATAAKVNLHVIEKQHYTNKGNSLLKKSGSILTAFDDVVISENAWHSFSDDTCTLCDAEFDEPDEHKVGQAHVMKLLQNKLEFGENNNIYRRIGKNEYQCLTCNCVPQTHIDEHFNSDAHKQMYLQCQEEKQKYDLANPKKVKKNEDKKEVKTADSLNNIETIAGNDVTKETPNKAQNTERTKATEEKIKETKIEPQKIDPTPIAGNDVTKETPEKAQNTERAKATKEKIKETKIEPQNIVSTPTSFAKENKLAYDPKNVNAFCKACRKKFPSTLHSMKEHVFGHDHINKIAKIGFKLTPKEKKLQKKYMEDFVKRLSSLENTPDNDVIINDTICLPEKSCHMFTKIASEVAEYKCEICLMNLKEDEWGDHCFTPKHSRGMRQLRIIVSVKNEFIREVRPGTFHCGYCNLLLSSWFATEEHLKTNEHKVNHTSCHRRLQNHLPVTRARKNDITLRDVFIQMAIDHMNS